jgi:hypothetical protein
VLGWRNLYEFSRAARIRAFWRREGGHPVILLAQKNVSTGRSAYAAALLSRSVRLRVSGDWTHGPYLQRLSLLTSDLAFFRAGLFTRHANYRARDNQLGIFATDGATRHIEGSPFDPD